MYFRTAGFGSQRLVVLRWFYLLVKLYECSSMNRRRAGDYILKCPEKRTHFLKSAFSSVSLVVNYRVSGLSYPSIGLPAFCDCLDEQVVGVVAENRLR